MTELGYSKSTWPSSRSDLIGRSTLLDVPDGFMFDVLLSYLGGSVHTSVKLSKCCRSLNTALSSEDIWKLKLIQRFGDNGYFYHPSFVFPEPGLFHPKDVYAATHNLEHRFSSAQFCRAQVFDMQGQVITCMLLGDADLIVGDLGGNVRYRANDDVHGLIQVIHPNSSAVTCLTRLNGHIVSGHSDGSLMQLNEGAMNPVLFSASRIDSITTTHEGHLGVCSSTERSVRLFDTEHSYSEVLVRRFDPLSSPTCIAAASLSSIVPSSIILGHKDNRARILDTRTGRESYRLDLSDWCLCASFSTQDPYIVKAADKAINFIDLRKPNSILDTKHKGRRLISKFASDDKLRLASCGLDGTVKVSSLERSSDCPVILHSDPDYILALDFNRTSLAYVGLSGNAHIFTF